MNWLSRTLARVRNTVQPHARPERSRRRLLLETLEDRTVPSTFSSIVTNFNHTAIPAGDSVWLNSDFRVSGLGRATSVSLHVTQQTVTFAAAGTNYTVNVPNATINLSSSTTVATTAFDAATNSWITNLPIKFNGDAFLSGVIVPVPVKLPAGSISSVTWSGFFSTDTAGVSVNWQWGAAVYTKLSNDYSSLDVKPLDAGGAATAYKNTDSAGTPETYKADVIAGATGSGGKNWTGNDTAFKTVNPSLDPGVDYPFPSSNPLTSVAFNDSDAIKAATINAANGTFDLFYNDTQPLALGVSQVNVKTGHGNTTTTNYALAGLTSDPGSAVNPAVGSTATTGDQAGTDSSGRPIAPSLYITDITSNPNSLSGDWQSGGTALAPSALFGTWNGFVKTVDKNSAVTLQASADPAKNGWNLGAGADAVPAGLTNQGYGAELSWNLNALYKQGLLVAGHTYRFYVIVHEGNGGGNNVAQVAYNFTYAGPPAPPVSPVPPAPPVLPPPPPPAAPQPASLSGFVDSDDGSGNLTGLSGVAITLTDATSGVNVATTTTADDGSYSFSNLAASTYIVTETIPGSYNWENAFPGTVNGTPDGSVAYAAISGITLNAGNAGINYDFTLNQNVVLS